LAGEGKLWPWAGWFFLCALGVRWWLVECQFVKFEPESPGEKIRAGNDIDSLPEDS
jgi:hypothetical protein